MYAKNRFSHTWGNSAPCNVRPSTPTYPFDYDSGELIKVTHHLSQMNAEHQRDITKYNRRGLCRCRSLGGFIQKAVNDHEHPDEHLFTKIHDNMTKNPQMTPERKTVRAQSRPASTSFIALYIFFDKTSSSSSSSSSSPSYPSCLGHPA